MNLVVRYPRDGMHCTRVHVSIILEIAGYKEARRNSILTKSASALMTTDSRAHFSPSLSPQAGRSEVSSSSAQQHRLR